MRSELPRAILLDFDGVIARNSLVLMIGWVARRLSRRAPVNEHFISSYVRSVGGTQRAAPAIETLFRTFGEPWSEDLLREMEEASRDRVVFDETLPDVVRACQSAGVSLRVFSQARPHLLSALPGLADSILPPRSGTSSKADPRMFVDASTDLGLPPEAVLMVDDCPMVLRAAKVAGFRTALVSGPIFTEKDIGACDGLIDLRLSSLADLADWMRGAATASGVDAAEAPRRGG